jgi:hypothetical protein
MAILVALDEIFDIVSVDENFPIDLNVWQAAIPNLAAPKPFCRADLLDQLTDRIQSALKYWLICTTQSYLPGLGG